VPANQKPNIFQRFIQWVQRTVTETVGELRKVNWPSRADALRLTRIVLIVLLLMGLTLGLWDFLCSLVFKFIVTL
jgi:preprotein translocase SecE subunit